MTGQILLLILPLVAAALALDWLVRPVPPRRFILPWRSVKGAVVLALISLALYGGFLALCGNPGLSALLAFALLALLALASNAKRAMLAELQAGIATLRRPALLVFFGDHRPSIPGASEPGGDRHTPYVVLRFDAQGQLVKGDGQRRDVTPAALHHAILDQALGAPIPAASTNPQGA